jgi:NADH dehydrogenase FAD-containing subunit
MSHHGVGRNAGDRRPHHADAQHGLREGLTAATNIESAVNAPPQSPSDSPPLDMASIGTQILGMQFLCLVARWLWRSVYLAELHGIAKKVRVAWPMGAGHVLAANRAVSHPQGP